MLKLHPSLNYFLTNSEDITEFIRVSANEIKVNGKLHKLEAEVCHHCDGDGKHLYGSMKGHAYTSEDFAEDPDFLQDMMDGKYDVTCEVCGGDGFILILMDDEYNKELLQEWQASAQAEADYREEIESERRMLGEY